MSEPQIFITRVEKPASRLQVDESDPSIAARVGGQWSWYWAVPLVHRAVAAPTIGNPLPSAPRRETDSMDAVGYWNALHHLLTYSLGWSRHDRGLRAWYDAGRPTEDVRLALLEHVWNADGLLDDYLSWAHGRASYVAQAHGRNVGDPDALSDAWSRRLRREHVEDAAGTTAYGKHLERHWHDPWERDESVARWTAHDDSRHATLVLDSAIGWMRALRDHGDSLPLLQDRAWRVDVVAKPIGFLGTFRRSWHTDIWFAGSHRLHAWGN